MRRPGRRTRTAGSGGAAGGRAEPPRRRACPPRHGGAAGGGRPTAALYWAPQMRFRVLWRRVATAVGIYGSVALRHPRHDRRGTRAVEYRLRPLRPRLRDHRAPAALPRPDDRRGRRQVREPVRRARRLGPLPAAVRARPAREAARRRGRLARDRRSRPCSRPGSGVCTASRAAARRIADPDRAGARRHGERGAADPQPLRRARRLSALVDGVAAGRDRDRRVDRRDRDVRRDRDRAGRGDASTVSAVGLYAHRRWPRVEAEPLGDHAKEIRSFAIQSTAASGLHVAARAPADSCSSASSRPRRRWRTSGSRRRRRPRSPRCLRRRAS